MDPVENDTSVGCMAYDLGGNVFSLRNEGNYFCQFPKMIYSDREGFIRRTVSVMGIQYAEALAELYTEDFYFRQYICMNEIVETQDYGDDTEYIFGEPLGKRIVGILGVSLKDGKQINVYNASDLYDLTIHNLSEYDNHLYFTCTGLDVPYNSLPDIEKNDFETNRIIRDTEVRSEEIYLLGIVGESCYGLQNGQLCYISADDFWNGRFSNAVFLTKNDYDS